MSGAELPTYREPAGQKRVELFDFERDGRRLLAHMRFGARVWRVGFSVSGFIAGSFLIAAHEPDVRDGRVPFYLALATLAGYFIAYVTRMGNNGAALIDERALRKLVDRRVWAVTTKSHGMVIFTDEQVFIERPLLVAALGVLERLDLDVDARTLRVAFTHLYNDDEGRAQSIARDETVALPELFYADKAEARERIAKLRARTKADAS
jgi:hypothetical protein